MKRISKKIIILLLLIIIAIYGANEITIVKADEYLSLNKNIMTIGTNSTTKLVAYLPSTLINSTVYWYSTNESVAIVGNDGTVTGLSVGTTIITATVDNQRATCLITVSDNYISLTNISLNKSSISLLIGNSDTLNVIYNPSNATDKYVSWSSSNPNVATVYNGKILAKSVGSTIITASSDNKLATCMVYVVNDVKLNSISINTNNITISEKSTTNLSVIYNPSNATNKKVTWKSSNDEIVTVDSNGKITGINAGEAKITAISNDGGYVGTCVVTVTAISKSIESISISKKTLSLQVGQDELISITYTPDYAENKNVKWTSSDYDVATVSNGKVEAISAGIATITATSNDGNKTDTCVVTVVSAPIESIKFAEEAMTIYIGENVKLKTVATPTESIIDNPVWQSSDETIARIDNGIVTGISIGESVITVSNEDGSISDSTIIKVEKKPPVALTIAIENYDIKFDPSIKSYNLTIGLESKLNITTNAKKFTVTGNQNLKNGSIITITIYDNEKITYLINIKKNDEYTFYFIGVACILLVINIVRLIIKNKKKQSKKF